MKFLILISILSLFILGVQCKIFNLRVNEVNRKIYEPGDIVEISYVSTRDDTGEVHVAIICSDCYEDSPSSHTLPEADQEVNGSRGTVTVQIPQTAKRGAEIYYCFVVGYRNSNQEWETTKAGPIYVSYQSDKPFFKNSQTQNALNNFSKTFENLTKKKVSWIERARTYFIIGIPGFVVIALVLFIYKKSFRPKQRLNAKKSVCKYNFKKNPNTLKSLDIQNRKSERRRGWSIRRKNSDTNLKNFQSKLKSPITPPSNNYESSKPIVERKDSVSSSSSSDLSFSLDASYLDVKLKEDDSEDENNNESEEEFENNNNDVKLNLEGEKQDEVDEANRSRRSNNLVVPPAGPRRPSNASFNSQNSPVRDRRPSNSNIIIGNSPRVEDVSMSSVSSLSNSIHQLNNPSRISSMNNLNVNNMNNVNRAPMNMNVVNQNQNPNQIQNQNQYNINNNEVSIDIQSPQNKYRISNDSSKSYINNDPRNSHNSRNSRNSANSRVTHISVHSTNGPNNANQTYYVVENTPTKNEVPSSNTGSNDTAEVVPNHPFTHKVFSVAYVNIPENDDELELAVGDQIKFIEIYDDDWALALRLKDKQEGMVPLTCIKEYFTVLNKN